jgi:hypothetical protein
MPQSDRANHRHVMSMPTINRPIIILGFHRSGTTLLGNLFREHPDVAFWMEPRHVWMHHFMYRRLDVLAAADATPRVIRQIHRDFGRFLAQSGRSRFAEKTPSNMVRLPFVRAVFPDAKVIHIIRDGRAATASTVRVLSRPPKPEIVKRRLRETPLWHYPAYLRKAWRMLVAPRLPGGSIPIWGPRIPGLEEWRRTLPKEEVCAKQWQEVIRTARRDAASVPPEQYREWRYEDLVTDPVRTCRQMFDFADLSWPPGFEELLRERVHAGSLSKWRGDFTPEKLQSILPHLEPLLGELGYSDAELPAPAAAMPANAK